MIHMQPLQELKTRPGVYPVNTGLYVTWLKRLAEEKGSSLFLQRICDGERKFYNNDMWDLYYKLFTVVINTTVKLHVGFKLKVMFSLV